MTDTHTHTAESLHALPDAEFNRVVAELDGYELRIDTLACVSWELFYRGKNTWQEWYVDTLDEAWALAVDVDVDDKRHVPDYANDLNAAWRLRFTPERVDISWWSTESGQAWAEVTTAISKVRARHAQPARALATAWVLWRQTQTTDERED